MAAVNVPECVYGVIDLYGQAAQATLIDVLDYSPDTDNSSLSNTTLYRCFLMNFYFFSKRFCSPM